MQSEVRVTVPTRVLTSVAGEATTFQRALEKSVTPDIIFIRNDGWTLGAPKQYERVAFKLWENEWVGFAERGEEFYSDIEDYYPSK